MLHLQGISKRYGSKVLFEEADAQLGNRSRIALVGPNGAGKSTLIRMILGQELPDGGRVSRASHLAIGHLAQETPKFSGRNVIAEIMSIGGRRDDLVQARQEHEEEFAKNPDGVSPEALERYGRVLEELDHLDEYRLEARAKEILSGMGFRPKDFERSLTEFSGGWLMRVALSKALLLDPDLLILDEPTNHLDLESLLWLEEFLGAHRGALLLVSHDTAFLNRMVTEVLEIDQQRLWTYRGNLDAYVQQKEERLTVLRAQYAGQQARIAEIEDFVRRFGSKATKARQAQSRLKELDRMDRIELPDESASVRFRFPPAPHSGREVVTMKEAQVSYGDKTVFQDLHWIIPRGSRIAIVGPNGAGKTTLLKLIAGELEPTSGSVKLGHEVKVGYYAQHQAEALQMQKTILDELETTAPHMPVAQVRGIAGAFLFSGDAVEKRCGVLSGGEKARVALAKLLLSPSNFLILDEPTNHLDVQSRGVLLEALQDYTGTICLVSHDRSFVSPLVDSVLEIIPSEDPKQGSQVIPLVGSYEDYLARKLKEAAESARPKLSGVPGSSTKDSKNADSTAGAGGDKAKVPSNNQRRAWERERDQLEAEITKLERKQAELTATLADPETYSDKTRSIALAEEQRLLGRSIAEKLSRWEELCGQLG